MIDLHTHSNASDGTYSPEDLVKTAIEQGISHLALTDHDTTDGLDEFTGTETEIRLIPGIELSVDFPIGELHIVGLFIDKNTTEMVDVVSEVKEYRAERNEKLLKKLSALLKRNIKISDIINNPSSQLGKPHIAKFLLRNGIVATLQEAFNEYLSSDGVLSVPKRRISVERAFSCIKSSGGVVILAHPSTLCLGDKELDTLIYDYRNKGLDGIEVFSSHSPDEKKEIYLNLAHKYNLIISGGSDFHGGNSKVKKLGADLGNRNKEEVLKPLYCLARERGWKKPI